MINLVDNFFQNSALFAHLPIFDEIYYEGTREGKVQKYRMREISVAELRLVESPKSPDA